MPPPNTPPVTPRAHSCNMGMLTSSYELQYLRSWGSSVAVDGSLQPFQEAKGTGAAQNLFCIRSAERGVSRRYCGRPSPFFKLHPQQAPSAMLFGRAALGSTETELGGKKERTVSHMWLLFSFPSDKGHTLPPGDGTEPSGLLLPVPAVWRDCSSPFSFSHVPGL